jgi:hypothetical protein
VTDVWKIDGLIAQELRTSSLERSTWVWTGRLRDGEIKTSSRAANPLQRTTPNARLKKPSPRNDGARFRFAST